MHPRRHQRTDVANHRLLGRTDIRQNGARLQMRRNPHGQIGKRPHRRAQHDAIRPLDRARGIEFHAIRDIQLLHTEQRGLGPRARDHLARDISPLARDTRDRTADQPDADQRQPVEEWFTHSLPP